MPTDRERAYMNAVDVLYGQGEKAALDTLYSMEMAKLAEAYPDDLEVQAFYAASIPLYDAAVQEVPPSYAMAET